MVLILDNIEVLQRRGQGTEKDDSSLFAVGDIRDAPSLIHKMQSDSDQSTDSVSPFIWEKVDPATKKLLADFSSTSPQWQSAFVQALNDILQGDSIYEPMRFAGVTLRPETQSLITQSLTGACLIRLNRLLLEDAYPVEIARYQKPFYDEPIKQFLTRVADQRGDQSQRLVIVASREPLTDLEGRPGYRPIKLDNLNKEEGTALLKHLGVIGTEEDLQIASDDYGGHALTLVLWGRLISKQPVDNVTNRHDLSLFDLNRCGESEDWKHATRVLEYYELKVAQDDEIIFLRMMSLFHRAMSRNERDHLLSYANFAKEARQRWGEEWDDCYRRLESFGLLIPSGAVSRQHWDCHPLIREHFRDKFKLEEPELWQQAHRVLFDYFGDKPSAYRPAGREELIPLYRAIHHGCLAHAYRVSLDIYRARIMQGDDVAYGANELGAIGEDAGALRMFFQPTTTELLPEVRASLDIDTQAWLQARTSFCLSCLGRLDEAIGHRQSELYHCGEYVSSHPTRESLMNAANAAAKLSELKLLVGKLGEAEQDAVDAVEFANRSDDWGQKMHSRCRLAAVKHMQGQFDEAKRLFEEAVELQKAGAPQKPVLYSDSGFFYRRFLLNHRRPDDYKAFLDDANSALDCDERHDPNSLWLIAIGLDKLSIASGLAKLALYEERWVDPAMTLFEESHAILRRSGSVIYFPEFYLARASFQQQRKFYGNSLADANEALIYATNYKMPLYRIDANIAKAHAYLELHENDKAEECIVLAETEMESLGYFRYRQELNQLRASIQSSTR